jgi:hypothetical protein
MTWPLHARIVYLEPRDILPSPDMDDRVAMGFASLRSASGSEGLY